MIKDEQSLYYQAMNQHFAIATQNVIPSWFWQTLLISSVAILFLVSAFVLMRYQVSKQKKALRAADRQLLKIGLE